MHIPVNLASPSTSRPWRAHRITWVIAIGIAAAACGRGFDDRDDAAPTSSAANTPAMASTKAFRQAAAPLSVEVEGCLLEPFYIPTTGTPVRALSADDTRPLVRFVAHVGGRLLGRVGHDCPKVCVLPG